MIFCNQLLVVPMFMSYVDLPMSENEGDYLCSLTSGTYFERVVS